MIGRFFLTAYTLILVAVIPGCTAVPEGIEPVDGFELDRYLGRWYEIARLDHSFERGLTDITAHYSLREDGGVRVINRGYSEEKQVWSQAEGRAYFVDSPDVAHLKVSFWGPFFGSYVVFYLDRENYRHALVSGPDRSYFWILSRTPSMAPEVLDDLVAIARQKGFDVNALIYVSHQRLAGDEALPVTER